MTKTVARSLVESMQEGLSDPRDARGVRHPFAGLVSLTLLGLLCRQMDFLSISRWASDHWDKLREPLGFTFDYAPHNTTLSRACARFDLDEFRKALFGWLLGLVDMPEPLSVAVDGKTSRQSHDCPDGDPIHV